MTILIKKKLCIGSLIFGILFLLIFNYISLLYVLYGILSLIIIYFVCKDKMYFTTEYKFINDVFGKASDKKVIKEFHTYVLVQTPIGEVSYNVVTTEIKDFVKTVKLERV